MIATLKIRSFLIFQVTFGSKDKVSPMRNRFYHDASLISAGHVSEALVALDVKCILAGKSYVL